MLSQQAVQATAPKLAGRGDGRALEWSFWALLLLFELFLMTLPLIPSGDGPVHIYLSSILWKLATHSSPIYEHYYAIRHLVQPYSFHYYFLILLNHALSKDASERVFAGLIWATLAIGFRSLVRAIDKSAAAASLLIFPLLFSWPFSSGFFNFTFGCGLLLFALSFYLRLEPGAASRHSALAWFVLTLVLLILAHPIPLMILIFILGSDLGFQLWADRRQKRPLRLPRAQAAALALCCIAFVFPILIADKSSVAKSAAQLHPHVHLLKNIVSGIYLCYFRVNGPLGWLYQALLVAILPAAFFGFLRSGLLRRFLSGTMCGADRLVSSAAIFLAATMFFPDTMNGSYFFAVRMWYPVWLSAAACMAAAVRGPGARKATAGFGISVGLVCLFWGLLYVRPVARQQAELEQAPLPPNARGLFVQPLSKGFGAPTHTWGAPVFWDGVRAFTAHDDVLLNTPWLQLTIVPIRENGRSGLMRDVTPIVYSESPDKILPNLKNNAAQRAAVLALTDFVLFADPDGRPAKPLALAASLLGPTESGWRCSRHDFYAVCTRAQLGSR